MPTKTSPFLLKTFIIVVLSPDLMKVVGAVVEILAPTIDVLNLQAATWRITSSLK